MNITAQHSKYFAYELTRKRPSGDLSKFTASLQDAQVDLNPHQVEAALFAFKSPLSKGALLADEVGLGKTIEAGIVLSQKWAEKKRKILIICPANLRKQWNQELLDKFFIPSMILETKSFNKTLKSGSINPFEQKEIILASFQFIRSKENYVSKVNWDLVVIDEAHRLRNVYKPSNKIANSIKKSLAHSPKILLTATPLQNSILELYGLISFIDEYTFGDLKSFKSQFSKINSDDTFLELKKRLKPVCKRTLRRQVLEYINYTNRIAILEEFTPYDDEIALYDLVSEYLKTPKLYALPNSQRQLMTLILRKLLASSTFAISGTLETIEKRLSKLLKKQKNEENNLNLETEFETITDLSEEWTEENNDAVNVFDIKEIKDELSNITAFKELAQSIKKNSKGDKLVTALKKGFEKLNELGANLKAMIFTESTRTQEYLLKHLSKNGYRNKIVLFNGSNNDVKSKEIYKKWIEKHKNTDRITGSRAADMRQAIVDYFKDKATIMIATEAAAEGINLQFCSLLVNFDMPWNPQRIEQRIGRVHRYGQKFDVVVINFLNKTNEADQRVYELLATKFKLFSGVFGVSDEVLGTIGSGVDFERRIALIYQECRKTEDIKKAFDLLQQEMDESINSKMDSTKQQLLEHFDDEVHRKLKINLTQGKSYLNQFENWLWDLTKFYLKDYAQFNHNENSFKIKKNPFPALAVHKGNYKLIKASDQIKKSQQELKNNINLYRIGHPLAQEIIKECKNKKIPTQKLLFKLTDHRVNISALDNLIGKGGYLQAKLLSINAFETEEFIVLSCITDDGETIPQKIAENFFKLSAEIVEKISINSQISNKLNEVNSLSKKDIIEDNVQRNVAYFDHEYEKLDNWADDMKISLEKEIQDFDAEIKLKKSEVRKILDLKQKIKEQRTIKELEKKRNEKRKHLFEAQDEIDEKKDIVLSNIEDRLDQKIEEEELFTIRWKII